MIGDNLKKAFNNEGLIVKEVAKKSGISKGTIDNWVNKGKEPRINALYAVCKAVNITLEQAVDDEAGAEYVRQWAGREGRVYSPPDRIADIVEGLSLLDDGELDMIRGAIVAAVKRKKRTEPEGSAG
jgi:transcriptional regulator with XRE-family HTH domain